MSADAPQYGIPKLLRVHFTNVGHAASRLDPLTILFCEQTSTGLAPVHATIWAENGVGKTSIRSLLFSVLQPDVHRVMKSANAGGGKREFQGFFFKGPDHAVILTEWIFDDINQRLPGMENGGGNHRILGMTANWSSRAAGMAVDKRPLGELERTFFSFTPNQGIYWDLLPVKGLTRSDTDCCKTSSQLLDWLRTHRQSIDLKVFQTQVSWREHLEELGLDPKLFDNQLSMNGSGGAIQMFKDRIRTPRDFVRFYLESALPEEIGQDLVELILQDRKIILERSKHEAGLEYLRAMQHPLDAFHSTVSEFRDARTVLQKVQEEAGRTLGMLDALTEQIALEIKKNEADHAAVAKQKTQNDSERMRLETYLKVLEHQTAKKEYQERQSAHEKLRQQAVVEDSNFALMEAHAKWRNVWEAEEELAPIEEQCQKLEAEEKEILTDLCSAAATWQCRLQEEVKARGDQKKRAENDLSGVQELLKEIRNEREELVRIQAKLTAEIEQLRSTIVKAGSARENLEKIGVLRQAEDPRIALDRHTKQTVEREDRATKQSKAIDVIKERLQVLRANETPLEQARDRAVKALQDAETSFADFNATKDRFRTNEALCWVLDTNELAIIDEGILEAIEGAIQHRNIHRDALSQRLVELRRRLKPLNDVENGLLAPPGDTEKVRQLLSEHKINVFTAGSWLDKNCDLLKAKEAIAGDPARYTGLMVHDTHELEKLKGLSGSLIGLDHPVLVSEVGAESSPLPSGRVVLLPEHPATYNRKAARQLAEQLRRDVTTAEEEFSFLTRQLEKAKQDVVMLGEFLRQFPKADPRKLIEAVAAANVMKSAANRAITDNSTAIKAFDNDLTIQTQTFARFNEELQTSRIYKQQIHDWLTRYGEILDDMRLPLAEQEIMITAEKLAQKQRDAEPLEKDADAYRNQIAELKVLIQNAEKEMNDIPMNHRSGKKQDWTLTRARIAYQDVKRRLEMAQTDDSRELTGRRDERRKHLTRAQNDFRQFCQSKNVDQKKATKLEFLIPFAEALSHAQTVLNEAKRQQSIAEHETSESLKRLNANAMPVSYQKHSSDKEPRDAEHGRSLIHDIRQTIANTVLAVQDGDNRLRDIEHQRTALESRKNEVKQQLDWSTDEGIEKLPWTQRELPRNEDALRKTREVFDEYRRARKRFASAQDALNGAYRRVDEESRKTQWDAVDIDKRRAVQQGSDRLCEIIANVLREYRTWGEVITDSLKRAEDAIGQITDRLTTLVKSDGLSVISHAQTGSRLPDGVGEWSERPFLKMEISGSDVRSLTTSEVAVHCKHVVRQLLSEEKELEGRDLIIRVLDELAGSDGYKVSILKPSHNQTPDRHSITELASWSDGEIITAAILLYCCVVQARTWHRTGARRSIRQRSNGILLLDNPFGEANSPNFVQLQIEMAHKLGVQLIYTASGDPRELLAMFRRNNRLYQRQGKGVKHVGVEDVTFGETLVGRGSLGLRNG